SRRRDRMARRVGSASAENTAFRRSSVSGRSSYLRVILIKRLFKHAASVNSLMSPSYSRDPERKRPWTQPSGGPGLHRERRAPDHRHLFLNDLTTGPGHATINGEHCQLDAEQCRVAKC